MLTYGKWATVRDDHISGAMPLCRWVTMRARSGYTSQIAVSDPRRRLLNGRAVTARNGAGEAGASPLTLTISTPRVPAAAGGLRVPGVPTIRWKPGHRSLSGRCSDLMLAL